MLAPAAAALESKAGHAAPLWQQGEAESSHLGVHLGETMAGLHTSSTTMLHCMKALMKNSVWTCSHHSSIIHACFPSFSAHHTLLFCM